MSAKLAAVGREVKRVLVSPSLRPAEIQILKALFVAVSTALGLDLGHVV